MERLLTFNVSISNGIAGKSFNGKFTAKIDFPLGYFTLGPTIADADIGSLKSLHTLFDKYLEHMLVKFEKNCGPNYTKF